MNNPQNIYQMLFIRKIIARLGIELKSEFTKPLAIPSFHVFKQDVVYQEDICKIGIKLTS